SEGRRCNHRRLRDLLAGIPISLISRLRNSFQSSPVRAKTSATSNHKVVVWDSALSLAIEALLGDDRPEVAKTLALGFGVRFFGFPGAVVRVADIGSALHFDGDYVVRFLV